MDRHPELAKDLYHPLSAALERSDPRFGRVLDRARYRSSATLFRILRSFVSSRCGARRLRMTAPRSDLRNAKSPANRQLRRYRPLSSS